MQIVDTLTQLLEASQNETIAPQLLDSKPDFPANWRLPQCLPCDRITSTSQIWLSMSLRSMARRVDFRPATATGWVNL